MPRLELTPILPQGWMYSKLTDACGLISRGRSPQYVDHSPIKAIGQRCVRDTFDAHAARGQNPKHLDRHLKALPGDVLLNSTGTGTIGRSCVFNDANDFVVDSHVTIIRPQSKKLHPQWVNMLLRSPQGQTNLETFCYAGSTNQVELARTPLVETEIPLPPLPEQRRIAEVLDTLDRTIERTERIIGKLKAAKTGLLHDLLTRGLDENGQLRDPDRNPELFKETELERMPKEWKIHRLDAVAAVSSGVTLGQNLHGAGTVELPYLRVANVQDGYIDLSEVKTVRVLAADVERFTVRDGDVLMNEGGDLDKLGRGAVWREQTQVFLHQNHVFKVRANLLLLVPEYLALVGASRIGKRYFMGIGKQTTNLASINSTQLKAFPIPLPSLQEQKQIIAKLEAFDKSLRTEQTQLAKLHSLKRGLMEDLLTGRVRVKIEETVA